MTITQMKYFVEVARQCNFSQVAERLYISQQALSKQIQALEKEIGVSLFDRENKRVFLTKAGKYLLQTWEPLLDSYDESLERVREFSQNKIKIGLLELGEILDFLIPFNQSALKENIEKEYVIDSVNNLQEQFKNRRLDILILFQSDFNIPNKNYHYRVLKQMPFGVICNKDHWVAKKGSVTIQELKEETLCCFDTTYVKDMEKQLVAQFSAYGVPIKEIRPYTSWRNLEIGLRTNVGVAITYEAFMPKNSEYLTFVPLSNGVDESVHNLVAAWHSDEWTELIDMLEAAF